MTSTLVRRGSLGALALAFTACLMSVGVAKSAPHDIQRVALRTVSVQHDRAPGPLEGGRLSNPRLDQG